VTLTGRVGELQLFDGFLDHARRDGAAMVLVGEAGVGKTALLNAAADAASEAGMCVLSAAGAEFEADMTFSTLQQALDPLQREFAQLSACHRNALSVALGLGDGPPSDPLVVSTAALALLRRAAAIRPLLVIVDDLLWVDRASAKVLGFVARRLAGDRIGFVAATRQDEDGFFDRSALPARQLQPLDDDAAGALVGARFPALAARDRRRVLTAARGNPLALLEFGAALSFPQAVANQAPGPVLPQSRRVQDLFAARIRELPDPTRRLLLLRALDGAADLSVLEPRPRDELAAAEQARLVYVDGSAQRLEFRHPLIRCAAVELSTDDERRRAHAALAELLDDEPDRQAWHRAEAIVAPDEQVAAQLEQAGHNSLRRGDAVGAVSALTRAAGLSPAPADRGRRLAEAAYIGADVAGELRNVTALLADAGKADASLETAAAAAFLLLMGDGDIDTAHGLLVGAIEHRAEAQDTTAAGLEEALHTLLRVCYFGGRAELWEPLDRALARLGRDAPAVVDLRARTQGDPVRTAAEALPRLDAAIAGLADEADPTRIVRVATASSFVDRLPGCRQALRRIVRDGREGGAVSAAISGLILLGYDDFWTGQWNEAEELIEEAVGLCEAYGYLLYAPTGRHVQALVAAARGDDPRTRSLTDGMLQWAAPRSVRSVQWGRGRRARWPHSGAATSRTPTKRPPRSRPRARSSPTTRTCCGPRSIWSRPPRARGDGARRPRTRARSGTPGSVRSPRAWRWW
jgi:hypothetical protein